MYIFKYTAREETQNLNNTSWRSETEAKRWTVLILVQCAKLNTTSFIYFFSPLAIAENNNTSLLSHMENWHNTDTLSLQSVELDTRR